MQYRSRLIAALVASTFSFAAQAALSPDEVARLGKDLTPFGSEKAGNKDGSIPAWDGGNVTPPADFKAGSGLYPSPFKGEKPLYTITAANYQQYADKLAEGQKMLFKRYPDYRMNVYPTHRTASFSQDVLEATKQNALKAGTAEGGNSLTGAMGGIPFPIPKTGWEAMWNHKVAYRPPVQDYRNESFYVDQSGRLTLTASADVHIEEPFQDPSLDPSKRNIGVQLNVDFKAPAAMSGQVIMIRDYVDGKRVAYQYIPAQRRAKLAPELAYDTPNPISAGAVTFDDVDVFFGGLDRYTWKLVGKKEMLMPYNNFDYHNEKDPAKVLTAKFVNPDIARWELHRVWVVEANLLPGKRHLYPRRTFYLDEDMTVQSMSDEYDQSGALFRHGLVFTFPAYDSHYTFVSTFTHYDFSSNIYVPSGRLAGNPLKIGGKRWSEKDWSPGAIEGRGVR